MSGEGLIQRRVLTARYLPGNIMTLVILAFMGWQVLSMDSGGSAVSAEGRKFPALTGRVVDEADAFDAASEAAMAGISADLEAKTGAQMVVASLKDLEGATIEEVGYQLGRTWGIGRKGYDDGVLLLVVPSAREVRIEVGYGLEGILTDALTRLVIEQDMIPAFKAGDMAGGMVAGAARVAQAVKDPESAQFLPAGNRAAGGSGFAPPKSGEHTSDALIILAILSAIGLIPVGGIASWVRCRTNPAYGDQLVSPPRRDRHHGGWGGGGGGGSSGGGFSGGGGSFGGGGSSGRW